MTAGREDPAGSLVRGRFTYFPVAPGRVEFAVEVRRALLEMMPGVVAVELPGWLEQIYLAAVDRLPLISAIVYPEDEEGEQGVYLLVEPADPFVEAVRTAREIGAELVFLEPDSLHRPHMPDMYPDTYAVRHIGRERYVDAYRIQPQPRDEEMAEHAAAMAWRLQGANPEVETLVVVSLNALDPLLDAMESPQPEPRPGPSREPDLVHPHPDTLGEILVEMPYLQERYERSRLAARPEEFLDRLRVQYSLLKEAEEQYAKETGERLAHWQRRLIARFSRNLAAVDQQLTASLYDLTMAARAIVDDNYAWSVWTRAGGYAWQSEHTELETVRLTAAEVFVRTRKMRLRRRRPRPKQRLLPRNWKPRPKERYPGEWAEAMDGSSICSYPPEDLVIEEYGRFLKKQARSLLSSEQTRVEPFTSSLYDGVDIRETIRNWHEVKLYVRQERRRAGDVGAVVIVFDEDREERYDYLTTWLGEHQNESDMAFYSTRPFERMVGPGIGRAEYGGLLMVLPPRRMMDVWTDPDYDFVETKAERLLVAALDYSVERHVVYAATRPPRSLFRTIANHLGRQIVYLPLGQLSPARLKRLRVVHVLDHPSRREGAKAYLW